MTKTVSARVNNELHEKLVNICNELGKTMNELLNDWIKEQSDLMSECISKDKELISKEHAQKLGIDRSNLKNWVNDLNKITVENA